MAKLERDGKKSKQGERERVVSGQADELLGWDGAHQNGNKARMVSEPEVER